LEKGASSKSGAVQREKLLWIHPITILSSDAVPRILPSTHVKWRGANKIRTALAFFRAHPQQLEDLAQVRALALLDDHRRVREAARDVGQYSVSACLPVDVIGVYVLLPDTLQCTL
jgi:hypothetical protein